MLPKLPQPELSPTCNNLGCCGPGAADTETLVGNPAGTLADREEPQEVGHWDSLKRSVLWFLAFFGIYASSSVCPFCGTPGCPVGVGGAAVVGAVFTCLWQYGKSAWEKLTRFITWER